MDFLLKETHLNWEKEIYKCFQKPNHSFSREWKIKVDSIIMNHILVFLIVYTVSRGNKYKTRCWNFRLQSSNVIGIYFRLKPFIFCNFIQQKMGQI